MKYEDWWNAEHPEFIGISAHDLARAAWDAAKEIEREECAKVCETWAAAHGDYFAAAIRARGE